MKPPRAGCVGDYRVIFRIDGATVRVLLIAHRSAVYADAEGRLRG